MKKTLIFWSWLLVAVLAAAGERVALWPEGKIPDVQTQQIAATTQEVLCRILFYAAELSIL